MAKHLSCEPASTYANLYLIKHLPIQVSLLECPHSFPIYNNNVYNEDCLRSLSRKVVHSQNPSSQPGDHLLGVRGSMVSYFPNRDIRGRQGWPPPGSICTTRRWTGDCLPSMRGSIPQMQSLGEVVI